MGKYGEGIKHNRKYSVLFEAHNAYSVLFEVKDLGKWAVGGHIEKIRKSPREYHTLPFLPHNFPNRITPPAPGFVPGLTPCFCRPPWYLLMCDIFSLLHMADTLEKNINEKKNINVYAV